MGPSPEGEYERPGSHRAGECQTGWHVRLLLQTPPKKKHMLRHARAGVLCHNNTKQRILTPAPGLLPREANQFRALAGFRAVVAPNAQRSSVSVGPPSPRLACCRGSLRECLMPTTSLGQTSERRNKGKYQGVTM